MRVLFAADSLLPARGGAERFALELLGALADHGHDVRAVWLAAGAAQAETTQLPPGVSGRPVRAPMAGGYWADQAARRAALAEALASEQADVVVTQGNSAPAAVASVPSSVLFLPHYEALCRYAFDAGSGCATHRDCVRCPRARALPDAEGAWLRAARTEHDRSLAAASVLVAPSAAVAHAVEGWCGRRPEVVPPVGAASPPARGRPGGHVLLARAEWSPNRGEGLLGPIAAALSDREVVITPHGLGDEARRAIGASGNVWFMDAPVPRLLEGASVCLVPSLWPEPFGRIAFDAQAAGIPVLASAVGGLVEVVPEGARIAPDAGPEVWAAAVRAWAEPQAWADARREAHFAATAILAGRPLERAVGIVEAAAEGTA
jgi:hypothetical protein